MKLTEQELHYCEADVMNTLAIYKYIKKYERKNRIREIILKYVKILLIPIQWIKKIFNHLNKT